MHHPIAGLVPPEIDEAPLVTVWPSIASLPSGRWIGQLASSPLGVGPFTLGNFFAALSIPWAVVLYASLRLPYLCRRYALTNRRVIIACGLRSVEKMWVHFEEFDAVEVDVLPGQQWFHAGDIVLRRGKSEVLRLRGVTRPEVFRQQCMKARGASMAVRKVLAQQAAEVA